MTIPKNILKYLDKYSVVDRWSLNAGKVAGIDSVVVIPALAEKKRLFKTLSSLSENPQSDLKSTLVLCVINNKSIEHNLSEEIDDNQTTLRILKDLVYGKIPDAGLSDDSLCFLFNKILRNNLRVAYVDASSPGCEMSDKSGGVGLARKIGLDLSLRVLDYENNGIKLLFSLDADTLVENNYLRAVRSFFQSKGAQTAVVEFVHQDAEGTDEQAAICCYEIFLRYYVLGLSFAGSPYAFHSIGSTMVCTADAYAAVRGMNRRKAGEDFYFLNKLAKINGVGSIDTTRVYPSSRKSRRVPFGTGKRIVRFLEGSHSKSEYELYDPEVFVVLKKWLEYMSSGSDTDERVILAKAEKIHPLLERYLREQHFDYIWRRLKKNSSSTSVLLKHFIFWFDGFKTLKLVNYLTRNGMPPVEMFSALRALMNMMDKGFPAVVEPGRIPPLHAQFEILECLRSS